MSRHDFECNGYTITPLGTRPVSASHFAAFGHFRKGGKSVTVGYPGAFATEELAREEVRTLARVDAESAPNDKIPF